MRPPDPSTLGELLAQARAGNAAAAEQLFQCSRNFIHLAAQAQVESWLRVKVDPSDLAQQTLLEAHRDLGRFQGGTTAEWLAWLRAIMRRNAADFVRHFRGGKREAQREVTMDQAPGGCDPVDSTASPSARLISQERSLRVAEAVAQLPEDYREVILLRNLQRLDFAEVARRMERTRPAVQMLWLRALRALQTQLGDDFS